MDGHARSAPADVGSPEPLRRSRRRAAARCGEKGALRIAVEVKTFSGPSDVEALEQAMGQHVLYRALLGGQDPGRLLFLAVPDDVWNTLFQEPIGETALQYALDRVISFDPAEERIIKWTPPLRGET